MKNTSIVNLALLAVAAISATTAYADCGKPGPRPVVSALTAARALPMATQLEDSRDQDGRPSVVGLWLTTGTIEGQQTQAFEAFTSDGLEFLNDNGSPVEGNVCFGVWQASPKGVISVTHPSWYYDANGNLIGTATIKDQFTVDAGGKTLHGTITVDIYDLNGNLQVHLAGTYTGKRITA